MLLLMGSLFAQKTGKVDYPSLGLSFTIPNGWIGQENQGVFFMGSNTTAGLILLTSNASNTLEAMETEARQGLADGNGTKLLLEGSIEKIGSNGIGAEFAGTLEGQAAKAYIIGVVSPNGNGLTIIAATTAEAYNGDYKKLALQVAQSLQFYQPVIPPVVQQWSDLLKGSRLTYLSSYTSNTGSYGGYTTGGGYSSKEEIDLCAQGYFQHSSNSSMSMDTGGAFGSSSNKGQGTGTWKVVANAQGQPVLQLQFNDGKISEYVLSTDGDKTFLNGYRYFRTYDAGVCN